MKNTINEDRKWKVLSSKYLFKRPWLTARKSKPAREVSNASDLTPKWFNRGVEAALLAPTAVNQQKFYIEYLGFRDYSRAPKVTARPIFSMVGYSRIDLGIVKCHFEIGAGKENFEWM